MSDKGLTVAETEYVWTLMGESYHEGSSPAWRYEQHGGTIAAEGAGEALAKIITGQGVGATLENTIPWDLIDQDREVAITIRPKGAPHANKVYRAVVTRLRETCDG